ncbi:MAG: class I SAM-dependent methyltransferase [Dehalococcoidia bacterium]|nr:class I SAM-dependent methyltransferase [Dehalococcoidia bacterium]
MEIITGVDWSRAWSEQLSRSNHQNRLRNQNISSEDFWDGFTGWQEMHRYTRYPGKALERVLDSVDPQTTVLDIGAGDGAFAVPLAKTAKLVTALEPSSGQIARLLENAAMAGVKSIAILKSRWEDVSSTEIGSHDVVVAAYCFQMKDIRAALQKMFDSAKRSLFLLHFVDHDLVKPLHEITGNSNTGPDYIYLLNILYEMGYPASLDILTRDYEIPLDLQLDAFVYSHGLSAEHRDRLRRHLESEGKVFSHDGQLWARRRYEDALIRLDKEERYR